MTEWTTLADIATAAGLPPGAGEVLGHMKTMPLASADDLAGVMKRSDTSVLANLRQLREANVVEAVDLGCTRRQRQRWYFTDALLHRADLTGTTWHEEHTRCRLLDILPALENAYAVAGAVELLGPFEQFQWLESRDVRGPTCDAAVRYSHGWMPIFWCGSLLSQSDIADRWARFPVDTQALAVGDPRPWPGLVCMVVQDEWERELVTRVLEDYGLTGRAVVRCVSDRTVTGPSTAPASRGWLYQPAPRMPRRPVSWDRSLAKSPWAGAGGLLLWRALEAVTQWPGGQQWFIKDLLEEPRSQHRVKNGLHRLAELALIVRVGDGRGARYFLNTHGVGLRAGQDRIHGSDVRTGTRLSQWQEVSPTTLKRPISQAHEDGLRDLLGPLVARGWPVANGVRHWEHLGSHGGIAPDAMVHLRDGPFGEGWAYLEYERSARDHAKVAAKIRGYGSRRRRDSCPLMLACWDDDAERVFADHGRSLGIRLLTTTRGRLHRHGPLGNDQCWRVDGRPVPLG